MNFWGSDDAKQHFCDLENRYDLLDEIGDPLLRLDAMIDWELFREVFKGLDKVERRSEAGRTPFDRVLMFKVLVLQRLYNLADERLEDQIGDRFLGPKAFNRESQLRVGENRHRR